jgi:hypothetical protein
MKRLYQVHIEDTIMVMAEDEHSAEEKALYAQRHEEDADPDACIAFTVNDIKEVSAAWIDSIPYGEDQDRTCQQILSATSKIPENTADTQGM